MLATFPTPVLSVTADAVKELDGREALYSLWNLFTKCKESLQDGHRLENISWRLWYREMMFTKALSSQSFPWTEDERGPTGDVIDIIVQNEKSCQYPAPNEVEPLPPSRLEADVGVPSLTSNNTPSPHLGNCTPTPPLPSAPSPALPHSSLASQQRRPSFTTRGRRNSFLVGGSPISVGKVIYDMLPTSHASPAAMCPSFSRSSKALDELSKHGISRLSISGPGCSCMSSESSLITRPSPHASNHNFPPSSSPPATTLATTTITDGIRPGVPMKCTLPDPPALKTYLPTPGVEIGELGSTANMIVSSIPCRTDPTSKSTSIPPSTLNIPNESIPTKPDSIAPISRPTLIYSGPPSPSPSESYACAHPAEIEIKEVGLLASLSPTTIKDGRLGQISGPFNTSSASQLPQLPQLLHQPPQLIVVDPTPNPTPHPTPPATPLLTGDGIRRSHFLTLPGPTHVSRRQSQPQHSPLHALSNDPEPDHDRSRIRSDGDSISNEDSLDRSIPIQDEDERLSPAQGNQHEMVPRNTNRNSVSSIASSNQSHTTNTTTSSEYSRTPSTADTSIAEDDSGAETNDKVFSTAGPAAVLSRVAGSSSTLTLQHVNNADSLFPLPPFASPLQSPKKKRNSGSVTTSVSISTAGSQPMASSSFVASPESASSTQTGSMSSYVELKRRASAVAGGGAIARRTSGGRNSSRSRSTGGSSAGMGVRKTKSRNHSRDSANKVLGMTAGGGVKKTSVPGSGRGRAKFVLGRASAAMANRNAVMKRAPSEGVLDGIARELSQRIGDGLKQGKARMGEEELEAEMYRQEMRRKQLEQEEQMEEARLEARLKETAEEAMREIALRQVEIQKQEAERKQQELLTQVDAARRPARFNIGSGSDGAKSAGSVSDISGGRSAQEAPVYHAANAGLLVSLVNVKEKVVKQPLAEPSQHAFLQQSQRQISKRQLQQPQKLEQQYVKHPRNQQQASAKGTPSERGRVEEGSHKCREKGKQKDGSTGASTGKNSRHTNGAVDPDLVAKVNRSLGSPLLPQNKRTIVLATSESEFETDSEDDGSWSSEEIGADDIEQRRKQPDAVAQQQQEEAEQQQQEQQRKLQEQQLQRRQNSNVRLPAVQRTNSSQYPTTHHHRAKQNARLQQQRQAQSNMQELVEKAALEAQRQRDMFTKLPTESFQDLVKARTQSVGLLTQLMNPNPEIFPPNHPYRRGFSSGEIRPVAGISALAPLAPVQPLTNNGQNPDKSRPRAPSPPPEAKIQPKKSHPPSTRSPRSPPGRLSFMQLTKKAPVKPVSSHVAVGSIHSKTGVVAGLTDMLSNVKNSQGSSSGYRPRGRPEDQELEDESDTDNDPGIQVSKSVAQERLRAYAERRNIQPNHSPVRPPSETAVAPWEENEVPVWARVSQPHHNRSLSQGQDPQRRAPNGLRLTQIPSQDDRPLAAPIPLGHPYNLPHPAPPSTPRTTRRLMLSTELSESLRRNLLWERQVSKVNLSAVRRTASSGGSRHTILGRLQPLTAAPSMVQLLPKGTTQPGGANNRTAADRDRRSSGGAANNQQDRENMQQQAMARNRSWADDYHYKGW